MKNKKIKETEVNSKVIDGAEYDKIISLSGDKDILEYRQLDGSVFLKKVNRNDLTIMPAQEYEDNKALFAALGVRQTTITYMSGKAYTYFVKEELDTAMESFKEPKDPYVFDKNNPAQYYFKVNNIVFASKFPNWHEFIFNQWAMIEDDWLKPYKWTKSGVKKTKTSEDDSSEEKESI